MPLDREQLRLRLIEHQIARLKDTYRDFLVEESYRKLTDFFFSALYSTQDTSKRDRDFKALYDYFRDRLGADVMQAIGKLIELNELTQALDEQMVDRLCSLARSARFTDREYEQGYRDCDNHGPRVEQIRMIVESMRFFHRIAHWPSMGLIVKVIKLTAKLKGAQELGDYLDQGFHAFRSVRDLTRFREAVERRELERLERIWKEYEPTSRAGGRGRR